MPNPTLTPTITDLARELAERVRCLDLCHCNMCIGAAVHRARDLLSALASPPVEAAQGEPLPCPFCGSKPVVTERYGVFRVTCDHGECLVDVAAGACRSDTAISYWNTRVAAPEARR
jgi:ribosomal protein L37AE/L43A